MAKQIKLGFDKVPAPITTQYPQLLDIRGNPLFDEAGNPLLTEEEYELGVFNRAENATSVHANNPPSNAVPVVEQFPEQSEVSTTLLGVSRAEVQLSLLSDVSTYGLDRDVWNYYTFVGFTSYPSEWYNRKNPVFGNRHRPKFVEDTNEQTLYLKHYPVQYTYPFGPRWERSGRYNANLFEDYKRFVCLGKYLYSKYINQGYEVFAKTNFLSDYIKILKTDEETYVLGDELSLVEDLKTNPNGFTDFGLFFDIDYGDDLNIAFEEVERFTLFWEKMRRRIVTFPDGYETSAEYDEIIKYLIDNTRPGYGTNRESFAILESRKSFRYQPGRISGFTFGLRAKTDLSSTNNYIEWGAANETDQYMFQIVGPNLRIVRRSVVPLPDSLLQRMGLSPSDARTVYPVGLDATAPHQELIIPKEKFNGDPLDGTGRSGYNITFEQVTMYKIEFSWYGAIGAKFYAYVPAGNGEARWVLLHTLVIENGSGQPIMKNPELKFKYMVYSNRTDGVVEPFYVYKYGASYYIDGGDEETYTMSTALSDVKQITERTPLIGILPKNEISSSYLAVQNRNYKKLYPSTISVSSDKFTRVDIEEIQGSPQGFHFHYAPNLVNGIGPKSRDITLKFNPTRDRILIANTAIDEFTDEDHEAKVIADGVYNTYIGFDGNSDSADILRRRNYRFGYGISSVENDGSDLALDDQTLKGNGEIFEPGLGEDFDARLSKYDFVASTVPISESQFKIHFLNTTPRDGRHAADFAISITPDKPVLNANNELVFERGVSNFVEYSLDENVFVDWAQSTESRNILGITNGEWEPRYGERFDANPLFGSIGGPGGGRISSITGRITVNSYAVSSYSLNPETGTYKLVFPSRPDVIFDALEEDGVTAEVGVNGLPTGVFYTAPFGTEIIDNENRFFVHIDADVSSFGDVTQLGVQTKSISLGSAWELISYDRNGNQRFIDHANWVFTRATVFNIEPVYLVIGMRDNSRINGIVVEQIDKNGSYTHIPKFLIGASSNIELETVAGESDLLSPSNFTFENRLSGARFDTQTQQPMRPGTKLYSILVPPNEATQIDLDDIFGPDRKALMTGLYNNRAIFFTATSLDGVGNAEMTVTVRER